MPEFPSIVLHFRFTSRLNFKECSTSRKDGARGIHGRYVRLPLGQAETQAMHFEQAKASPGRSMPSL